MQIIEQDIFNELLDNLDIVIDEVFVSTIADHNKLRGLSYEESGHTGFASAEQLENVIDSLNITYNETTGEVKFFAGDKLLSTFDLPVERLVKRGYYDSTTLEIVLVLDNDDVIRIPAANLVDTYLADEETLTLNNETNTFSIKQEYTEAQTRVIEGYAVEEEGEIAFYKTRNGEEPDYTYTDLITGVDGKLYVDLTENTIYRYSADYHKYIMLGSRVEFEYVALPITQDFVVGHLEFVFNIPYDTSYTPARSLFLSGMPIDAYKPYMIVTAVSTDGAKRLLSDFEYELNFIKYTDEYSGELRDIPPNGLVEIRKYVPDIYNATQDNYPQICVLRVSYSDTVYYDATLEAGTLIAISIDIVENKANYTLYPTNNLYESEKEIEELLQSGYYSLMYTYSPTGIAKNVSTITIPLKYTFNVTISSSSQSRTQFLIGDNKLLFKSAIGKETTITFPCVDKTVEQKLMFNKRLSIWQ